MVSWNSRYFLMRAACFLPHWGEKKISLGMTTCCLLPWQLHNWGNNDILGCGKQSGDVQSDASVRSADQDMPRVLRERPELTASYLFHLEVLYWKEPEMILNHSDFLHNLGYHQILSRKLKQNDDRDTKENNFLPNSSLLKWYLVHCSRLLHNPYILLSLLLTEHSTQFERVRKASNGWYRAMWILKRH